VILCIVSDNREPDFSALEPHIAKVLDLLMPNKTLSLVNVNLPDKPKGIRWTRQSVRHYDGKVVPDKDPMGRSIFWFTVTPLEGAAKGTDRWAIEHHWVSITPLRLDLTDEADLTRALAVSDTTATRIPDKRRQQRRSASKSKSSSRRQK
jgi:5'-nucleotidase